MTPASRSPRGRRLRLLSTVLLAAVTGVGLAGPVDAAPAPAAAPAAATAAAPTTKVIVILKDQVTTAPADTAHLSRRVTATRADQATVLARLAGPTPTNVKHFTLGNAFSASVTAAQRNALAHDPAVASVSDDKTVNIAPASASTTGSAGRSSLSTQATAAPSAVPASVCSTDPKKPTLEPEALQTMNVRSTNPAAKTAAALGIDGSGVKVAYLADGLNPNAAGFLRANGTSAVVDYQDFYGDGLNSPGSGAEAFGDVSAVVAQGNVVYDLATFGNPKVVTYPGGHCYARIVGVAPGASMVALKVGSELLPTSAILQGIDYAVTVAHVDVLNESFGGNPIPDSGSRNAIQVFDEQAVAAGVTVTVSSGDSGITNTIGNPATSTKVISVGASTDSRNYIQDGYALADRFGNGTWQSNNISALSSAGITGGARTIDVSAPGESDWAVCDDSGNWSGCRNYAGGYSPFETFGGTSQSAPLTAGVAALVIQAYRKTHKGVSPTPAQVKQFITSTARDLGFSGEVQGSGIVDARAAVEAALTAPGATSATPAASSNILLSTNQLTLTGAPGANRAGSVTVTNVGATPVTVVPSTRRYANVAVDNQSTTLTSALPTVPYPTNGTNWYYTKLTFTVPAGTDVLNSSIYWSSGAVLGGPGPVVRLSLFDPSGAFATNTRPQGAGGVIPANYGTVLVRRPKAGTWTAVLYTPATNGFLGKVNLTSQFQRAIPVGSVSPNFTLAPGASRNVTVTLPTALQGGDNAYTMSLGTSTGHQVAVPIIVRTVIPTQTGAGQFSGTITGGNARGFPAQTFSYDFDVRGPKADVTVTTELPSPGNVLETALIAPNGEVVSLETTVDPDISTTASAVTNVAALPLPGRWRLVVAVVGQVTGDVLSQTFHGTVQLNGQRVFGHNVPRTDVIKAGTARSATLTITNPSAAPMYVQLDPRLYGLQRYQLAPIVGSNTVSMPVSVDDLSGLPAYLVPPQTSTLSLSAAADVPTQVELGSPSGGIDVVGDLKTAQDGSTVSTATVTEAQGRVGQGFWFGWPSEIGPFGLNPAPSATATLTATAIARPFATDVTSSTGDPYLQGIDPTADAGTPLILGPGQTGIITVTITPTGKAGQKYSGVLNVVTTPYSVPYTFGATTGDVVAEVPFGYTVG